MRVEVRPVSTHPIIPQGTLLHREDNTPAATDPKREGHKLHHSLRQKLQEELLRTPAEVTVELRVYQGMEAIMSRGNWAGWRVEDPSGRKELE